MWTTLTNPLRLLWSYIDVYLRASDNSHLCLSGSEWDVMVLFSSRTYYTYKIVTCTRFTISAWYRVIIAALITINYTISLSIRIFFQTDKDKRRAVFITKATRQVSALSKDRSYSNADFRLKKRFVRLELDSSGLVDLRKLVWVNQFVSTTRINSL